MARSSTVWTIGHSNHDLAQVVGLLAGERIEFVADVRSFPYSRFVPQFNRDELKQGLRNAGLDYLFLGEELGGRPARPEHYDSEGHALYGKMAEEPNFQQAVQRLVEGASAHRIALLCSEGSPQECHRRLLVGRVLAEKGVVLRHILPSGEVIEEERVSVEGDNSQPALFDDDLPVWRSTQSVSQKRRLSTSSAA